jgi:DNA-binding response OmpR family regulator
MRVLIVEDEPGVAQALTWRLAAEGYVVDTADNGTDGLWKATENSYDVIVLDVMLPGMDGNQVCRRLRERGRWTPIMMLTAMDHDLDHAEGLDSGADAYLGQPVLIETRRGAGYLIRDDATGPGQTAAVLLGLLPLSAGRGAAPAGRGD